MTGLFGKLQLKDQKELLLLNAPQEFQPHLGELAGRAGWVAEMEPGKKYGFILVFVLKCAEIDAIAAEVVSRLEPDGLLWFAYPKKSSKKYRSDIGRDDSWEALGKQGFEAVRQVAIDEDWSALRFRHASLIQSMKRDARLAMSDEGKQRTRPDR